MALATCVLNSENVFTSYTYIIENSLMLGGWVQVLNSYDRKIVFFFLTLSRKEIFHILIDTLQIKWIFIRPCDICDISRPRVWFQLLSEVFVGPRLILWGHWCPLFWTWDDSAVQGFPSHSGFIISIFCHLPAMIPRVICGCRDWESSLDRSHMRRASCHCTSLVRLFIIIYNIPWPEIPRKLYHHQKLSL